MLQIVSGCSNLALKEYKKRHDKVELRVHWELIMKSNLKCGEKWHEDKPLQVIENDQVKPVWDSTIVTERCIPDNRPIVLKEQHQWPMVYVAVLANQNRLRLETISSTRST